ncbi:fungal-specific transcription factor domain-containing protein [Echria macrotheca]|uniref:Fungal-specific transcription factor domain-containing protein n=1 Tax=Echria macrotheca TaxID=438768 RepID=A0AAJ0F2S1_9PEZI|nr:fungal-specific transcription factor domain-containing protein [Echria macrotheca]
MADSDANWSPQVAGSEEASNADGAATSNAQDGFDAQQIHALARHPPPGASVYSPNAAVSSIMNPRSCVTCRRRKVRCDKLMPCSNCRRAQIPCIFPAPGRAPRRPRPKDPNAPSKQPSSERELELMKRLRKLEGIVEELSGQIEVETVRHPSSAGNSPENPSLRDLDDGGFGRRHGSAPSVANSNNSQDSPAGPGGGMARPPARGSPSSTPGLGLLRKSSDVHKQFGRLVLNEKGVTRYVSSTFWNSINDELDEIRQATHDLTEEDSDEYDVGESPESTVQDKYKGDHQSFILGYRSADVDLRPLHPLPSQIPYMWQVFQENVDPILKILHVPTMNNLIRDLRKNMDNLTPSTEALMFSIYYAAITSLDEDEVKNNFGHEKSFLLQQYRFALEQALAKANFILYPDLTLAQAFLMFLVLVRRHDDTRFAWTLTGLMIRISQALGLHRDGTHFPNLSPFEIEMRRRLFWAVCVLDLRSAEDQGTDLNIVDRMFDTQQPLNINDADISPDSPELPKAREGPTDMTFSLIRFEICSIARRMHHISDMPSLCPQGSTMSLEDREALLAEIHRRVENKYLKDPRTEDNPMYWTAAQIARLIVSKMRLIIYQSALFPGPDGPRLSEDKRSRLFNAATEVFEYSYILNTDPRAKQWRWLFQTYTQLHAVAYVLIEVSHRPWSATVERCWGALNMVFSTANPSLPQFDMQKMAGHSAIFLPLRKMYLKAKRHRESEIARLQADPIAAQQLELEDRAKSRPETFGALSSSVKTAIANERWRKLVNAPPLPPDLIAALNQPQQTLPSRPAVTHDNSVAGVNIELNQDIMDHIESAITNPAFNPVDLGMLWSRTADQPLGTENPGAIFGVPMADIPRSDSMAYNTTPILGSNQQSPALSNPAVILKDHRNLPPWMWPDNGMSDPFGMPNIPAEELDVTMDETFDWQNWQESLGKYELDGNGTWDGRTGTGTGTLF